MEKTMRYHYAIGVLLAALTLAGSTMLSAQDEVSFDWHPYLVPNGETVYDVGNSVTWLADANLAGKTLPDGTNFRFGLPLCDVSKTEPVDPCVNAIGTMNYASAEAWVGAMNAANYLGHSDWQLPTTPKRDGNCPLKGPNG